MKLITRDTTMKQDNLFEKAYQHYQDGGIGAVCDFANKENIKDWDFCAPCDCETPILENTCLVCGQTLKMQSERVDSK